MDRLYSPPRLAVPFVSEKGRSVAGRDRARRRSICSPRCSVTASFPPRTKCPRSGWRCGFASGRSRARTKRCEAWMRRWKQTPNIIRALWEPLCIAALNEPVATASAQLFATVIRRSFLAGAADSTILLSRVGLSELFAPEVERLLEMCGGTLRLQAPVTGLRFEGTDAARNQTGRRFHAPARGGGQRAAVACAARPSARRKASWRGPAGRFSDAPIVSLHLWLDRPDSATSRSSGCSIRPCIGFSAATTSTAPNAAGQEGHVITAVVSGARDLVDKTGAGAGGTDAAGTGPFPARGARTCGCCIAWSTRRAARPSPPRPKPSRCVPGRHTEWSNFWLAGDWTDTGLPATIEGAILSGRRAAAVVDNRHPEIKKAARRSGLPFLARREILNSAVARRLE